MERFLDYFRPCKYQLEECIFRQEEKIKGKVQITGRLHDSKVIKLHAVNMEVKRVSWRPYWCGYETKSDEYGYADCEYKYDGETIEIPITPAMLKVIQECNAEPDNVVESDPVRDQDLELEITFSASINHNMEGCYLSSYNWRGSEQRLVATQFESHYAREAFPCVDEPAAKAIFDLTLILPDYNPAHDIVLANTQVIGQINGRFEFASTPPMSTYLLAWVAGPLQGISTVNQNGVRVSSYCALNQPLSSLHFANETAARALEYYDQKFAEPYPLPKLDQVALPDFEAGAMENWGLVTYRESCLLADNTATLSTRKSVATTVTHELSHQWFGNLITMQWWDDLWLNESFATIMEYFATDYLYPDFHIWQDFFTSDCLAALRRDALRGVQSVQQPVHDPAEISTLFDSAIVYAKGARLVLMLIRLLGEDKFDQGVQAYFGQYKYHNTVGDDLWRALQPYADFDVKDFMHAWISQPGYPALQHAKNGEHEFWQQQRFLIDGTTDDTEWPVPEVKDDMSGHYLLDLPHADFAHKLQNFTTLSAEQKLRLLIDRMLLARAGNVDSDSLLELLPQFVHEDSAAVWGILASIIGDLKLFCPLDSAAERDYKTYLSQIYQPRFDQLQLDLPNADSNAIELRDLLLSLARYVEDSRLMAQLAERYDCDFAKLSPELRVYIIAAKMLTDEQTVFKELLAAYPEATDPELRSDLLYTLALVRQPEHLDQLIKLLSDADFVRPQDHIFFFVYLLRNPRSRTQVLDWTTEHWNYIKQLTGDKSLEDYIKYLGAVLRTDDEAETFRTFTAPLEQGPMLKRAIEISRTEITARIGLIQSQGPKVVARLTKLIQSKSAA